VYDLYAVSNHYGGYGGGHYTAYARDGEGAWHCYDDSHVSRIEPDRVQSAAAYVLFYRRRAEAEADPGAAQTYVDCKCFGHLWSWDGQFLCRAESRIGVREFRAFMCVAWLRQRGERITTSHGHITAVHGSFDAPDGKEGCAMCQDLQFATPSYCCFCCHVLVATEVHIPSSQAALRRVRPTRTCRMPRRWRRSQHPLQRPQPRLRLQRRRCPGTPTRTPVVRTRQIC